MQLLQEQQLMLVSKDLTQQQIIKGKRTKRQRLPSPLRLAMSCNEGTSNYDHDHNHNERNSKGIDFTIIKSRDRSEEEKEEEDMANCLILLAQGRHHHRQDHNPDDDNKRSSNFYLYQCKTCNRCFPSFQALGGHRASHSKPNKPNCNNNATRTFVDDHYDPTMNTILSLQAYTAATPITTITTTTNAATKKSKVHECSICGAEFSSGQALGGHMRRHRTLVNTSTTTTTTAATTSLSMSIGSPKSHEAKKPRNVLKLDLNLPAPEVEQRDQSKFSFQPRENVIAFSSNSSLVDCHF